MTKPTASNLSVFPAILALLILVFSGYLLFANLIEPKHIDLTIGPPIEIIDEPPPLIIVEPDNTINSSDDVIEQEAEIFVAALTENQDASPITMTDSNDQFVRLDSTILLPKLNSESTDLQEFTIQDLIQSHDLEDNALFYLHRVSERDRQGLWGIIQAGLINKFREGLQIEDIRSNKDLVQVAIPADADEKLTSGLSSFLGTILDHKTDSSYIYNFNTGTMTHDTNLIHPGQQLIMVHFSSAELKQIYRFFSDKRNQGIEIFAIPD